MPPIACTGIARAGEIRGRVATSGDARQRSRDRWTRWPRCIATPVLAMGKENIMTARIASTPSGLCPNPRPPCARGAIWPAGARTSHAAHAGGSAAVFAVATSLAIGAASCATTQAPEAPTTPRDLAPGAIARAQFDSDNHALTPIDWRRWVYVGTPLTPNALNKGKAAFPEFHNVYVEPSAFDAYMKTGTWAQGTQIVKELVLVRESDNQADGSSIEPSGRGYFQGEFHGLELLVKDQQRFGKEPGGWAFFSFGHKAPPYDATATALPASACSECHETAETDFVFTQYYPVLRARTAKPGA
jgi:hypothetical protein